MKKYFSRPKFKRQNVKRIRASFKKAARFKEYRKKLNLVKNLPKPEKRRRGLDNKYKRFKKVVAPTVLSFLRNTEGVIKFIHELNVHFVRQQKVFVILKDVTVIDYDALVVLLSLMVKFKSEKIDFNGDFPDDAYCRQKLMNSKFLPNLYKYLPANDRVKLGEFNSIHTHAWKNVDSKLSATLIERAAERIWKSKRRCQGVQRTLIELMQNTNNHATVGLAGDKHWWLSVNYVQNENKVCFSFVDFGVGVFESLSNKQSSSKFYGWLEKMQATFKYQNNAELLKLILDGELHSTVTGKHYRGKGLPGIREALSRNQISNLHIVTNNVIADVGAGTYRKLNNNFEGTFLYWELNEQNINCHGTD